MTPLPSDLSEQRRRQLSMWDAEPKITGTAAFSPCRLYRYELTRTWDYSADTLNFVMLNPSTADAFEPDNTIARCIGFAKSWGFGSLVVTNLFAFKATDPKVMKAAADPVGPENDQYITANANDSSLVVCAWGNNASQYRAKTVLAIIREAGKTPHALRMTDMRHPAHPLYLPANLKPQPMEAL